MDDNADDDADTDDVNVDTSVDGADVNGDLIRDRGARPRVDEGEGVLFCDGCVFELDVLDDVVVAVAVVLLLCCGGGSVSPMCWKLQSSMSNLCMPACRRAVKRHPHPSYKVAVGSCACEDCSGHGARPVHD